MIEEATIWGIIGDWDWMTEAEREEVRVAHPEVQWDLTVDWTRVGDDMRRLQGIDPIIKPRFPARTA